MEFDKFTHQVRAYCVATGASVTSWGRSPQRNVQVGGVPLSPHLAWLAVDVTYDDDMSARSRVELAEYFGLLCIVEGDHDHLQPLDWRALPK